MTEREIQFERAPIEPEKLKKDPVGLFLEQSGKLPEFAKVAPSSADFSYLSPEQRAESMWALFQDVKRQVFGMRVGKKKKLFAADKAEPTAADKTKLAAMFGILKTLYGDQDTQAAYLEANTRYLKEIEAINGNYDKYRALSKQIKWAENVFDASARQMFAGRGEGVSEMEKLLFETSKRELAHTRVLLEQLIVGDPELGALVQHEILKTYGEQFRKEKFIWSPSRRRSLEEIELAALSGKPVLLSGESGTGKTRLVEQAALILTGRINNETPGKDVRFQDLIAKPKIAPDGRTYYEYKEIGEAATGKATTLEEKPGHDGRIIADDEFNLLPQAEQTERMARIAAWTPGKRVRMPVTNTDETIASKFLYCAMVNLASQRYERKKIPPEVLRKFAKVDLDYSPQTEKDPELYEMMLAALIDKNGRMRVAIDEVVPQYVFKEEMKTIERDRQRVKAKIQTRELQNTVTVSGGRTKPAGGFLWRFANALHELNKSFSHRDTVLKSRGEAQYVKELVIDVGTVLGWLKEYSTLGRTGSLESFIAEKLKTQFLDRAAYSGEDRQLVRDFLKHFGIDIDKKAEEEPAQFQILTDLDVGLLSPRVTYEKILSAEPEVTESYFVDEDGNRIEYDIKPYEEKGRTYKPGDVRMGSDKKLYEFFGITKEGVPIWGLHREKPAPRPERKKGGETTLEQAREILGNDFLGPEAVEKTFGVTLEKAPEIPFSVQELERAKELGHMLILRVDKTQDGQPLSMAAMNNKWAGKGKEGLLNTAEGWQNFLGVDAFSNDAPRPGWVLVSKELLPNSTSKNYIEQTELIIQTLENEVFKDRDLPDAYKEAIEEFNANKSRLIALMDTDWQKAAQELSALKITKLARQSAQETIYDLAIYYDAAGTRLLPNKFTWTYSRSAGGRLVGAGGFGADGVRGPGWDPRGRSSVLGVSLSRSA